MISSAPIWDIFCQVVDNHGDLGVCWRLSQHLLGLGQRVRLYVDQAQALSWMAPRHQELEGLSVLPWPTEDNTPFWRPQKHSTWESPQCVIEAFGCEIPQIYLQSLALAPLNNTLHPEPLASWTWINLEYLSAEDYPERMHRLASPVMHGAAKGKTKWFFYPGFTQQTGGLLKKAPRGREEKNQILISGESLQLQWDALAQLRIFLFSYEPQALHSLLLDLSKRATATHLKVSAGRSTLHVQKTLAMSDFHAQVSHESDREKRIAQLRIEFIDPVDHNSFDALLASSDLNFVRGEDSWIRAIWAQKAFVWQIYPQDDGVHLKKMNAFLQRFQAPSSLKVAFGVWNGFEPSPMPVLSPEVLEEWRQWSQALAQQLMGMPDLAEQLCDFLALKQHESRTQMR